MFVFAGVSCRLLMRLVYSLTLVIEIKSQSALYLDAYSWESFISVSNHFTIIRWSTLTTVLLKRMTTMPTRLHHQHWSKCCSCKPRCCKPLNRPWQICSKHKDINQLHNLSRHDKLREFQWTKPPTSSHSVEPMDADDWLKTIEKKLQVV
jgi:hypothetical protein